MSQPLSPGIALQTFFNNNNLHKNNNVDNNDNNNNIVSISGMTLPVTSETLMQDLSLERHFLDYISAHCYVPIAYTSMTSNLLWTNFQKR